MESPSSLTSLWFYGCTIYSLFTRPSTMGPLLWFISWLIDNAWLLCRVFEKNICTYASLLFTAISSAWISVMDLLNSNSSGSYVSCCLRKEESALAINIASAFPMTDMCIHFLRHPVFQRSPPEDPRSDCTIVNNWAKKKEAFTGVPKSLFSLLGLGAGKNILAQRAAPDIALCCVTGYNNFIELWYL